MQNKRLKNCVAAHASSVKSRCMKTTPLPAGEHATGERTYDLSFTAGRRGVLFRNASRGVTLTQDCITWTYDGRPDSGPFGNIVEIRLQSGGDWRNITHLCEIVFADRYRLIVRDCKSSYK